MAAAAQGDAESAMAAAAQEDAAIQQAASRDERQKRARRVLGATVHALH